MFLLSLLASVQLTPLREPTAQVAGGFAERVAALALEALEKEGVPGLSVAVAEDGCLVLAAGWGYADASRGIVADPDTSYEIGSLAHSFTAVAILELAERGALSLDDDLARWVPDFPTQGLRITLRQLLSETSGIPGYDALATRHGAKLDRDLRREELFRLFEDVPFEFSPGTGHSAANPGYVLLALVVANASGSPYTEYVRAHVLEPLELDGTRFVPHADRSLGFARGCKEPSQESELELAVASAAGAYSESLTSTAADLVRWQRAIDERLLIGEDSTRAMSTASVLPDGRTSGHGFATAIEDTEFARVVSHTGGTGGFRARLAHYVEPRVTVVVLANCASADVERLERSIARAALDLASDEIVDLAVDAAEIRRLSGTWQIETQQVVTFGKEGRLWFEYSGRPAFALQHQGKRLFVSSADEGVRVLFRGKEGESPDSFEITRRGFVSIGRRMGPLAPR